MLRPIRRLVPPIANVDLSPLVLILVLLVLLVPIAELRQMAAGLF
jgi:YggT family protein